MSGSRCGTDGRSERGGALAREGSPASRRESKRDVASFELGIGAFVDDEGGYTSVAVALALLVSLSLVCSLVSVAWVQNRSADVQSVADSAALAGANVVAAYSTVATTLDACVLTLGLAGMVTLGAGLVVSAVPGLSTVGAETIAAGVKMLAKTHVAVLADNMLVGFFPRFDSEFTYDFDGKYRDAIIMEKEI